MVLYMTTKSGPAKVKIVEIDSFKGKSMIWSVQRLKFAKRESLYNRFAFR